MKKKLQKIVGIMLILFASCFGGLAGCKDKYADMKVELDQTSINLFLGELDEDGKEMNNTATFTASVSGAPSGASLDVFAYQSTPSVITITKDGVADENGDTTFTIVANQAFKEPVIVSVRTKEGEKVASLEVLVTKKITNLAVNPQYAPYVVVGEEGTILDVTRGLIFTPEDTSQDKVTFSIDNANGHEAEITENGKLVVTRKNGTQPVMVKVTSEASGIEPVTIPVKVIEPIQDEDIKLMIGETQIIDSYIWAVQNLKNTNELPIHMEISSLEDIRLSSESGIVKGNCFDVEFDTEHTLTNLSTVTLFTNESLGTGTLKLVFVVNGFDYKVEKNIEIQVAKLPSQILVNDQDVAGEQVYVDIFDNYQNQLGLPLRIEVGDATAYEKRFVLSLVEEDKDQIILKLADGTVILKDEDSVILPTRTTIYVSAIKEFVLDSVPAILIKTNVEENNAISTQINFSLKTSATNVEITAYGNNENNIYVEKGQSVTLIYNTDTQNAYLKGLTVEGYDASLIDVEIDDSGENAQKPVIRIIGKKINNNISSTTLKIKLPNGFESNIVNVHVFIGGENIVLTAPSIMDAQYGKYIADIESYDNGNLKHLTIAKQGYAKLNLSVKSQNNEIASYIEKVFELVSNQDSNFITVNNDGLIYARNVKQDDGGLISVKATIKYYIPKANEETGEANGDVSQEEETIEFTISVYTQITSINLDKQFITLFYTNNLWFDNFNNKMSDVNKQKVNLQISPLNASVNESDISWKLGELVNSNIGTNVTNNNRTIELTGNVGINGSVALTVTVVQKNKIFSKTAYITMKNIIAPNQLKDSIDIENIEIKYDNANSEKLYLGDESSQTISISGNSYKTYELYLDSRNLTNNSTMHIDAYLSNEGITNKTICYEVLQGSNLIRVNNSGNIEFVNGNDGVINAKNGGVAYLNIYAQGSRLGEITSPTVYKCIKIVIANGKGIETAYQIDSENEFWAMIQDNDIQNHYYKITRDIYLANDFGYTNAYAPKYLDGQDKNKENIVYSINNLKVNKATAINENLDFVALFGVLNSNSSISNLNIYMSLNAEQGVNKDLLVAGLVATSLGNISNVHINAQQFNVNVNSVNKITIGGIVAENGIIDFNNSNQIRNCAFEGNININASNEVEFVNDNKIFVGGMVGNNVSAITSNNINFTKFVDNNYNAQNNSENNCTAKVIVSDNIKASNNSAIGGVVGYNFGNINGIYAQDIVVIANNVSNVGGLVGYGENERVENNYINAFVSGKDNVGGLVGYAKNIRILNNIVEIYENDYVEEKFEELETEPKTLNVISGANNVGGLVGFAQNSLISNSYAKSYLNSLYVYGQTNVGGLVGYLQKEEINEDIDLQTSFAYMFTKAYDEENIVTVQNIGGLVGYSEQANILNVYSRGTINEDGVSNVGTLVGLINGGILQNAYSTISGTTHNEVTDSNASVSSVFGGENDKTTINSYIVGISGQNCWTTEHSRFNDGYAVLYIGENSVVDYILEKLVPTEIVVGIINNNNNVISFDNEGGNNKLVLKAFDGEISIDSLFTLTSQNDTIPKNDLKIYFDNSNVLKIRDNKLSFVNFGTTTINFVSKYSKDVINSCEITVVSNVKTFDVSLNERASSDNTFNIKVNTNNVIYSLINGSANLVNTENLYVKVAVDVSKYFEKASILNENFDANKTYFMPNYVQAQNIVSASFENGQYFIKQQVYVEATDVTEGNFGQYYVIVGESYEPATSFDDEMTYYAKIESYEPAIIFEEGVTYYYENYEIVSTPTESEFENYFVCTFDFDSFNISNNDLSKYENNTYYEYFKYDTLSVQTLKKLQNANVNFALCEKVGESDNYVQLLGENAGNENINQELKVSKVLTIFEGILSIKTNKTSLNMTTLNEVSFVLTVETDIQNTDDLKLQLANQQYAILVDGNNQTDALNNYVVEVIISSIKSTQEVIQGSTVYTYEYQITLKMRDEYLMLNNTYGENGVEVQRKELKEGFETELDFAFEVDQSKTTQITLTVEPQNLLKIDAMHFPNGLEIKRLDGITTEFYPNELPNNSITPGEFGLLMVDIYPAFANYDEIEITYESNNGSTMTFVQVAKATVKYSDSDNSTINRFLEIKPSAIILNKKIVLSRISEITLKNNGIADDSLIKFDGRYYVKTLIPTSTDSGTIYSITIRAITYNTDGTIRHELFSPIINLETMPRPNVHLSVDEENTKQEKDGVEYIVINRGGKINIDASTKNYSSKPRYTFIAEGNVAGENYMITSVEISGVEKNINSQDSDFKENISLSDYENGTSLFVPLSVKSGTKITLTASVSRFINGIEVAETDTLHFLVVDYIITGLKLESSVNNSINIIQGEPTELKLELLTKNIDLENYQAYTNLASERRTQEEIRSAYLNAGISEQDEIINSINKKIDELSTMQTIYRKLYNEIVEKIANTNEKISQISGDYNYWLWYDESNDSLESLKDVVYYKELMDIKTEEILDGNGNKKVVATGKTSSETPITNLLAEVCYIYNTDGETKDGYEDAGAGEVAFKLNLQGMQEDEQIDGESEKDFIVQCKPNIYVATSSTADNPIPVYTISQLLNMGNEDRILMNDLYLTTKDAYFTNEYKEPNVSDILANFQNPNYNTQERYYYFDENTRFTSITPNFKSFDGNNHKIYINSFALAQDSGNNYGFFTSLASDQLVKNLEIVFLNQKTEITSENPSGTTEQQYIYQDNYNITADDITKANFGLFVGKNEGVITNCKVSYQNVKNLETNVVSNSASNDSLFTLTLDEKISAVAGGFVGVNNGYITNSNISATNFNNNQEPERFINIEANGTIGGFVGENNFKIGSCYALNVALNNSSKTLKDTKTAGFVGDNKNNASITQSFAEFMINGGGEEKIVDCNVIASQEELENATISSLGTIGGFVHTNSGNINNSYSNVAIETPSRSAGFVYINTGNTAIIRESYTVSISKNQSDTSAFRYFTGNDEKSKVNNLDNAVIKNSYYQAKEIYVEQDVNFKEPAIRLENFSNPSFCYGFNMSAGIWDFVQYRPILATTIKVTSSERTLFDVEYTNGIPTNYKYIYSTGEGKIGTENNPVVIYNAESFLKIFKPNGEFKQHNEEGDNIYNVHVRLVKDIDFENFAGTEELRNLQSVNYVGSIDGNGFDFNNVRVLGETGDNQNNSESFGLFKQIGTDKIYDGGAIKTVIKNLNINIAELSKSKAQMVGVLAGKIIDSTVTNVSIYGENITVEGQNMVGGLAGLIKGSTSISNISSNVNVDSAYVSNIAEQYRGYSYLDSETQTTPGNSSSYIGQYLPNGTTYNNISYAGGIAGVIDIRDPNITQNSSAENEQTVIYKTVSGLKVYGNVTIEGEIAGGIVGYLSKGSELYDSNFELGLNDNQNIVGLYSAGGLVGENNGSIRASFVQVNDNVAFNYDKSFHNNVALHLFENDKTNPKSVGGLVGFMPQGQIKNSFSKANVIHHNAQYIGGIVGEIGLNTSTNYQNIKIDGVYTTGNVYTTPNYIYSYEKDGSSQTYYDEESIIHDGTITSDITATPQNYIGGLFGKVNFYHSTEENSEESISIFKNIVAINDWNNNILGYNSKDVLNQMNVRSVNRKDDSEDQNNILKDEDDLTSISKVIYETNYGYFCGSFNNINNYDLTQITTEYLYLNNSICTNETTNTKIQNQVGNRAEFNYLKFDGQGDEVDYNPEEYDSQSVKNLGNLRKYYRDYREHKNQINNRFDLYIKFNEEENIWDFESNIYPVISHNILPLAKDIFTEEDLFSMADTSSIVQTYYLKNDIYLTRNWRPINGFKGIFMSVGGPFTIYNLNINTETHSDIGFFGSTENALIRDVNFVFGGHVKLGEDGQQVINDDWNTENGNYPYTEGEFYGTQTLSDTDFGGIKSNHTNGENNLSALVGKANSTIFSNIKIGFTDGMKIDYHTTQATKVNSGLICANAIKTVNSTRFEKIQLSSNTKQKDIINQIGESVEIGESVNMNVFGNYSNLLNCNIGGLFGDVANVQSIKDITSNIELDMNVGKDETNGKIQTTIGTAPHNRSIKISAGFASINNSTISSVHFNKKITINSYVESTSRLVDDEQIESRIYIGGFAGEINNSSNISQVSNSETAKFEINVYHSNKNSGVTNHIYIGGFAGEINSSKVSNDKDDKSINSIYCDINFNPTDNNNTKADGNLYFGGIVGFVQSSQLKNIEYQGTHTINQSKIKNAMMGGAFGQILTDSTVDNIISSGSVSGNDIISDSTTTTMNVGGFVGLVGLSYGSNSLYKNNTISNCATLTNIFVKNDAGIVYTGGFVGKLNASSSNIKDCITYSNVQTPKADHYDFSVGGFVGQFSNGKIEYCTSLATLFTEHYQTNNSQNIGGFAGSVGTGLQYSNCSYSYNLSGVASNGIGEKNENVKQIELNRNKQNIYYDIETSDTSNTDKKTVITTLKETFGVSSPITDLLTCYGSKTNPEAITIDNINTLEPDKNYYLASDINGESLTEINIPENVTIIGSYISGYITKSSARETTEKMIGPRTKIVTESVNKDVLERYNTFGLINAKFDEISENSLLAGIIINYSYKEIDNSNNSFAGFANTNNGTIFNCSVMGRVYATSNLDTISAFVDINNGYISNCSSSLIIDANGHNISTTSGFVNDNNGSIAHSFSNGEFNNYYNSTSTDKIFGFAAGGENNIYGCYSANVCIDFGDAETCGFSWTLGYDENIPERCAYDCMAFNAKNNGGEQTTDFFLTPTKGGFANYLGGLISFDKDNNLQSNIWTYDENYNYGYPMLKVQVKLNTTRTIITTNSKYQQFGKYFVGDNGEVMANWELVSIGEPNEGNPIDLGSVSYLIKSFVKNTGNGTTSTTPYLINHGGKLDWIRTRDISKTRYFKQVHDIDLSAFMGSFVEIGSTSSRYFTSCDKNNFHQLIYAGNNHVIDNSSGGGKAIFEEADTIRNLGVNYSIKCTKAGNYSGIVNFLGNTMDSCFANIDITVDYESNVNVAGLVFAGGGTITNSFAIGQIVINKAVNYSEQPRAQINKAISAPSDPSGPIVGPGGPITPVDPGTHGPDIPDSDITISAKGVFGISGANINADNSCYSAVSIIDKGQGYTNIYGTTRNSNSTCFYDDSISLTMAKGRNISFASSWLMDNVVITARIGGESNNNWTYSRYNYPVQNWVVNNHYATTLLGYQTNSSASDGTGSQISPYQVNNDTKLNNMLSIQGAKLKHIVLTSIFVPYNINTDMKNVVLYGSFSSTNKASVIYSKVLTINNSILSKLNLSGAVQSAYLNSKIYSSCLYDVSSTKQLAGGGAAENSADIKDSTLLRGRNEGKVAEIITNSKIKDYYIESSKEYSIANYLGSSYLDNIEVVLSYTGNCITHTSDPYYGFLSGAYHGFVAGRLNNCKVEGISLTLYDKFTTSNILPSNFNIEFKSILGSDGHYGLFFGRVEYGSLRNMKLSKYSYNRKCDVNINFSINNTKAHNFGVFVGSCEEVDDIYNAYHIDNEIIVYNINIGCSGYYGSNDKISFNGGIVVGKADLSYFSNIDLEHNTSLKITYNSTSRYSFNIGALVGLMYDGCYMNDINIFSDINCENNHKNGFENNLYIGGAVGLYYWCNNSITSLIVDNYIDVEYRDIGDIKVGGVFGVIDFLNKTPIGNTGITRTDKRVKAHQMTRYTVDDNEWIRNGTLEQYIRLNCINKVGYFAYDGYIYTYTFNTWNSISGISNKAFARVGGYAGGLKNSPRLSYLKYLWTSFNKEKAPFVALRNHDYYGELYKSSKHNYYYSDFIWRCLENDKLGQYRNYDSETGLFSLININNKINYKDIYEIHNASHASVEINGYFQPLFANPFIPIDCTLNGSSGDDNMMHWNT